MSAAADTLASARLQIKRHEPLTFGAIRDCVFAAELVVDNKPVEIVAVLLNEPKVIGNRLPLRVGMEPIT